MNTQLEKYLRGQVTEVIDSDLRKHDVSVPPPWPLEEQFGQDQIDTLVADYRSGTTSRELAERLGVGKTAIIRLLSQHGVLIRPRGS